MSILFFVNFVDFVIFKNESYLWHPFFALVVPVQGTRFFNQGTRFFQSRHPFLQVPNVKTGHITIFEYPFLSIRKTRLNYVVSHLPLFFMSLSLSHQGRVSSDNIKAIINVERVFSVKAYFKKVLSHE